MGAGEPGGEFGVARDRLSVAVIVGEQGGVAGLAEAPAVQQHFGLLRLSDVPGAYIVDAYPVIVRFWDIVTVFLVISFISMLTVFYPINNLKKKLNAS